MRVNEIMTHNPAVCPPEAGLREVARLMVRFDCGLIPVIGHGSRKPVGVVTDRDIACRTVAQGMNPLEMNAREIMTSPCVTVFHLERVEDCVRKMEECRIRRMPVVDEEGGIVGIVSQADLARYAGEGRTAELVEEVSEPQESPAVSE